MPRGRLITGPACNPRVGLSRRRRPRQSLLGFLEPELDELVESFIRLRAAHEVAVDREPWGPLDPGVIRDRLVLVDRGLVGVVIESGLELVHVEAHLLSNL